MKYQMEIENISLREKILLIKGYDSWKNSNILSIRSKSVNISAMNIVFEKLERYGLTINNLIATWDAELLKQVLPPILAELKGEGVNAVILNETLINNIHLPEYIKTQFFGYLIDILQIAGIKVFVEAMSIPETIMYSNATGFVVNQVNLVKVNTDKPILVDNNGLYFIYTSNCQFLTEEEILNGNRASHGAPNGATPVTDKEIDDALDKMMEVADLINAENTQSFTKDDQLLNKLYQQSIVVVKNNKNILPLVKEKRYILVTSQDISEFETYLTRNGFICKTISVSETVQLSPSELNGYDTAIMIAVDESILLKTAETIKNHSLELLIIKASKYDFEHPTMELADAYIETFSNNLYRLYQLKRVVTGEIIDLGFTPAAIPDLNIPEAYSALSNSQLTYQSVTSTGNSLNLIIKNSFEREVSDLFVLRLQDTNEIIGFARGKFNPYEQKNIKFFLGGSIATLNIESKNFVFKDGRYSAYFNENTKINLAINSNRITVLQDKTNKETETSTTGTKYRLPKTTYVNDKPLIILTNIVTAATLLISILALTDVIDGGAIFGILAAFALILLVVFNIFVKQNKGLSQRVVRTNEKPIAFDEIFNSKPEKQQKEKVVETEEVLETVEAVEIDLDQVEVGIELTEQEKVISYLKEKHDINSIVEDIKVFMHEVGIDADIITIKNLLASMAANHAILVKSQDTRVAASLVEKFGQYFSKHAYVKDLTEVSKESEVLKDSKFVQSLKYAMLETESIQVVGLNNLNATHFESVLNKFEPFFKNHKASAKLSETMNIEKNVWMFMILDPHESEYNLPQEFLNNVVVLNVEARETIQTSVSEHQKINYYQLLKLVSDCKKEHLLTEVEWKKIDALESYVNKTTPFVIGNKVNTQIENFVAVLQATNVDSKDSLDLVVSEKLLPIIIPVLQNQEQKPEVSLVEEIESIFGEENIALSLRTIRSSRLG